MIKIYTDGACSGNPGIAGCAFVVVNNEEECDNGKFILGEATNNIAELYAMYKALYYIHTFTSKWIECEIYSDSNYVVEGINKWLPKWMQNEWIGSNGKVIKNVELWKNVAFQLMRIKIAKQSVNVIHILGHSGNKWNDLADRYAKECIKKYKIALKNLNNEDNTK
jgi:ribonuclease HI